MCYSMFFFFNDTATTEIYTLSLHDALPILAYLDAFTKLVNEVKGQTLNAKADNATQSVAMAKPGKMYEAANIKSKKVRDLDRKSTRLNSSHSQISYAVFCLKKKKTELLVLR